MGKLTGKVAFISGAARGQGRSHVIKLAEAGADIVAIDLCEDIESNHYPLGTWGDLCDTAATVEKFGQRAVIVKADVRDAAGVRDVVADGVGELGRLDIVVENAGILPMGNQDIAAFQDTIDVNLVGIINVMGASLGHVGSGASLIAIGSVVAFRPDLVQPTREDALVAFPAPQALPIPYVEPEDISNAVLLLATDDSRYCRPTAAG